MEKDTELVMITGTNPEKREIFLSGVSFDFSKTYFAGKKEAEALSKVYHSTVESGLFLLAEYDRKQDVLLHAIMD